MRVIRLALAQINAVMGDFSANIQIIRAALIRAREAEADIVLLPELAVCGYPPEDLLLRKSFHQANEAAMEAVKAETQGLAAVVGFAHATEKGVYNAAALLQDGRLEGIYHKMELPNYGVFDEKRYFLPGKAPLVFYLNGFRLGMTICEDVWVEGGAAECALRAAQVDVALNISASPFHAGKLSRRRQMLGRLARQAQCHVAYVNMVGGQDELVFDGGSMLITPEGRVQAGAMHFAEDLLITEIALAVPAQPAEPGDLVLPSSSRVYRAPAPAPHVAERSELEEIFSALVLGTHDYVRKNGFKKCVIGLSGGIDSALTAALAVEALGPDNVIGVSMPSEFSSAGTQADAEQIAGRLGIAFYTIPIHEALAAYQHTLAEFLAQGQPGTEEENLQARIRGNILMALSNRFGWLVLTTGNKSETAVGYCTLYGDMAGGFAVIKDVPKTLVYDLSRYLNQHAGREIIPQSVFDRPPTAELRHNQRDEDSLPPYSVLDPILTAYIEEDLGLDEIIAMGFDPAIVREVLVMVDRSEYKRRQAPPGIKITPKAFGRDRRIPLTNRFTVLGGKPGSIY